MTISSITGQGRWKEAVPLLRQSQAALAEAFGEEYEALGEAEYYLALAAVPRATEVGLADLETGLIAVGNHSPIHASYTVWNWDGSYQPCAWPNS